MSAPDFEFDKVFDPDDYLYFYEPRLSPERTEREVELIWRLLGLAIVSIVMLIPLTGIVLGTGAGLGGLALLLLGIVAINVAFRFL